MINLMKYLKKSAGYIVLIIGLLFLQAYCDLSLPDYTSKVINVGIQQGGIPDGVPEKMRQSTMENLQIFYERRMVPMKKINALAIAAQQKVQAAKDFLMDTNGSDTTEKIGMVVVAVVIVGLLAVAVKTAMPGLFNTMISTAQEKLSGIF